MSEQVHTCSYCGECWPESEMDLIEDVCGLCEAHPSHPQDRARRTLNKLAHKGMEAGKAWQESRVADPEGKDTWLHTQRFMRFLREYWTARRELEEEERKLYKAPWRNEGE